MSRRSGALALLARLLARLLALVAGLALLPLALAALLLALLQSESVRLWAETAVDRLVPGVRIEGLGPGLPARLDLARVELADDAGTWLTVEDIAIRWRPSALFSGRIVVERVAADRVALARPPAAAPEPAAPAEPQAAAGEPFRLPGGVPPVTVETLAVERIELGAPVLGEAVTLTLDGRLGAADGTTADLALHLARIDRTGLDVSLDARLELEARRLALRLAVDERSGLAAALTGEPALEPIVLELAGEGPLGAWPGRLELQAGELAELVSTLEVGLEDPLRLALDGRIEPGPALAATPYAPLLADGVELAATVERAGTALTVERLRVATEALALAGTAALRGESARVDLDLSAADLAALAPLTGTALAGSARVTVALDGALPLPPGAIRIEARKLRAGEIRLAAIDQRVDLRAGDGGAVVFDAAGDVTGITVPAGDATFGESLRLEAAGSVTPGGPFALERLALDGRSVTLAAGATGDLGAGELNASADLRLPDLAAFRAFSPAAPRGAFALDLTAALAEGFTTGTVRLDGGGRGLAELPAAAQALVGAAPTLAAELRLADTAPALRLDQLAIEGARFGLDGAGSFDPAAGEGAATLALRVPALAPVGEALGQPLAGSLALDLDARSSPHEVDAEAVLVADGLAAAGQRFEQARVAVTARGAPSRLTGRLDTALRKSAEAVTLASGYALTAERVTLDALELAAPGVALTGAVDLALAPLAVDGRLAGGGNDLAPLGRWLELPLAGGVDLELTAAPAAGQSAALDATVRGLEVPGLALERLDLTARGTDLLATPRLDARAELAALAAGAATIERAEATAAGGLDALAVTLDAAGALPQRFDLAAAADLALAGSARTMTLTRLDGELEELPIRLTRPATVRMDGPTLALEDLDLEFDTGRLEGDATLGPERVDGLLQLQGLRLERLGALGVPPLAGELATSLRLAGTRRAPSLEGEVALTELRPSDAEDGDAEDGDAAAALDLDWQLGGGRLEAALASTGFGEPGLAAQARLPVRFALEPFTFALPAPLPLDATVTGELDLARVAAWYGLEGRLVEGWLASELAVAGTTAAPDLTGGVTLAGGRFIDLVAGIVVEDLRAELAAEGRRLVVREFAASDGAEGRLGAAGAVDFADALPAFDVTAELTRFALLQSEELYLVMSGSAAVAGAGADLDVEGAFTVERGDLTIPGGGGAASFASLDVVERAELQDAADAEEPGPGGTVALDIRVDIPGRLFVRGRGLVSEWGGGIEVGGTAAAPSIEGMIEYRRGFFDLFDRRFQLRTGELNFTGATPPDPFVLVEATVELPDTLAVLRIDGPALDPELTVTSEPPLPEDEVLAQLLFDRNASELNTFQSLRLAAAVNELRGGGAGFGVLDRLRTGLGVDTLGIGGESAEDATLQAGTYLSEDVFVEIERGLQPGSAGATVEVELTPRIQVETKVREDSTASVGLTWSFDY